MKDKQLKELCERAGMECSLGHWYIEDEHLERFAELVRQDEREACAKLCEDEYKIRLAETIRARR